VILLLRGNDELSRSRRLQRLKDDADGGTGMLSTNYIVIEGRDATPQEIIGAALTPPFLAPQRLVLVEGFLDRWESDARAEDASKDTSDTEPQPAAPDRQAQRLRQFEPLFAAIEAGIPPSTMLVLTGGAPKRTNPMAARLVKTGAVTEELLNQPEKDDLLRFIRDEGAARGVRFRASKATDQHWENEDWRARPQTDPVALVAGITNGNTMAIAHELDKLALFSMGRDVTVDDVYEICSGDREPNQFAYLDAIQDGKPGDALRLLDRLRERDDVTQLLIAQLTTRFRQAATIAELLEQRAPEEEVGRALGNAGRYPGLRQAAMRRAGKLGLAGARAALAAIAEADFHAKKGDIDHEVGIEILTVKLARLAATR
jgi:DNA polymerase III delta subunit